MSMHVGGNPRAQPLAQRSNASITQHASTASGERHVRIPMSYLRAPHAAGKCHTQAWRRMYPLAPVAGIARINVPRCAPSARCLPSVSKYDERSHPRSAWRIEAPPRSLHFVRVADRLCTVIPHRARYVSSMSRGIHVVSDSAGLPRRLPKVRTRCEQKTVVPTIPWSPCGRPCPDHLCN